MSDAFSLGATALWNGLVGHCIMSRVQIAHRQSNGRVGPTKSLKAMTVPVLLTPHDGSFVASLVGTPDVRGIGQTRDEAIHALKLEVLRRAQQGEIVWVDIEPPGLGHLAGSFADDATLRDLCEDIYRQRDAERQP